MCDWRKKPKLLDKWPDDVDYSMFIDENSSALSLKTVLEKTKNKEVVKREDSIFTITGCILTKNEHQKLMREFSKLKTRYWQNRKWYCEKNSEYQTVCFHSREIRNHSLAFRNIENYDEFLNDLTKVIDDINFTIISISIDLTNFIYKIPEQGIYEIAFKFLFERFVYFMKGCNKGVLVLESRGKKEDKILLQHINEIIFNDGTEFIKKKELEKKIKGVYFDPKFKNQKRATCPGLELTDLCSYPIHKYIKYGTRDQSFDIIEPKFYKYPNYENKGIKIFPKK